MTNGNVLTESGKKILLNRSFKASPDYSALSKFGIGFSNGTPLITDTELDNPIPISGTELADNCETVGNWAESADGSDSLNSTTYKEGAGALNLIKAATTADNVTYYNNNNMTSLTFTSKTLFLWLYIKDATTYAKLVAAGTAVEVRYGTDYDTNYYYKNYTKANLAVGWNCLYFSSATATGSQGTPGTTSFDSGAVKITFTATSQTLAAGDVILDEWKLAETADFVKTFATGYPTLDETNFEAQIRCELLITEANGYSINGVKLINTDGTVLMGAEATIPANSKSSTDEFVYIWKMRFL